VPEWLKVQLWEWVDRTLFGRMLAERFRNVIAWPHVQDLILQSCNAYLQPGLDALNGGDRALPALMLADVTGDEGATLNLTRDLFVLKATLLSAYVRYSGVVRPIVGQLGTGNATARLAALRRLLANPGGFGRAIERTVTREIAREELRQRLNRAARVGGDATIEFGTLRAIGLCASASVIALRSVDRGGLDRRSRTSCTAGQFERGRRWVQTLGFGPVDHGAIR
jgi:hypothetical protein